MKTGTKASTKAGLLHWGLPAAAVATKVLKKVTTTFATLVATKRVTTRITTVAPMLALLDIREWITDRQGWIRVGVATDYDRGEVKYLLKRGKKQFHLLKLPT